MANLDNVIGKGALLSGEAAVRKEQCESLRPHQIGASGGRFLGGVAVRQLFFLGGDLPPFLLMDAFREVSLVYELWKGGPPSAHPRVGGVYDALKSLASLPSQVFSLFKGVGNLVRLYRDPSLDLSDLCSLDERREALSETVFSLNQALRLGLFLETGKERECAKLAQIVDRLPSGDISSISEDELASLEEMLYGDKFVQFVELEMQQWDVGSVLLQGMMLSSTALFFQHGSALLRETFSQKMYAHFLSAVTYLGVGYFGSDIRKVISDVISHKVVSGSGPEAELMKAKVSAWVKAALDVMSDFTPHMSASPEGGVSYQFAGLGKVSVVSVRPHSSDSMLRSGDKLVQTRMEFDPETGKTEILTHSGRVGESGDFEGDITVVSQDKDRKRSASFSKTEGVSTLQPESIRWDVNVRNNMTQELDTVSVIVDQSKGERSVMVRGSNPDLVADFEHAMGVSKGAIAGSVSGEKALQEMIRDRDSLVWKGSVPMMSRTGVSQRTVLSALGLVSGWSLFANWGLYRAVTSSRESGAVEFGDVEVGAVELGDVEVGAVELGDVEADSSLSGTDLGYPEVRRFFSGLDASNAVKLATFWRGLTLTGGAFEGGEPRFSMGFILAFVRDYLKGVEPGSTLSLALKAYLDLLEASTHLEESMPRYHGGNFHLPSSLQIFTSLDLSLIQLSSFLKKNFGNAEPDNGRAVLSLSQNLIVALSEHNPTVFFPFDSNFDLAFRWDYLDFDVDKLRLPEEYHKFLPALRELFKVPKPFLEAVHRVRGAIQSLKEGEQILLFGGYSSLQTPGHFVAVIVERNSSGFLVNVCNTGDGLKYHSQEGLPLVSEDAPKANVVFSVQISPDQETVFLSAVSRIMYVRLVARDSRSAEVPNDISVLYEVLQSFSEPFSPVFMPPQYLQVSGTCWAWGNDVAFGYFLRRFGVSEADVDSVFLAYRRAGVAGFFDYSQTHPEEPGVRRALAVSFRNYAADLLHSDPKVQRDGYDFLELLQTHLSRKRAAPSAVLAASNSSRPGFSGFEPVRVVSEQIFGEDHVYYKLLSPYRADLEGLYFLLQGAVLRPGVYISDLSALMRHVNFSHIQDSLRNPVVARDTLSAIQSVFSPYFFGILSSDGPRDMAGLSREVVGLAGLLLITYQAEMILNPTLYEEFRPSVAAVDGSMDLTQFASMMWTDDSRLREVLNQILLLFSAHDHKQVVFDLPVTGMPKKISGDLPSDRFFDLIISNKADRGSLLEEIDKRGRRRFQMEWSGSILRDVSVALQMVLYHGLKRPRLSKEGVYDAFKRMSMASNLILRPRFIETMNEVTPLEYCFLEESFWDLRHPVHDAYRVDERPGDVRVSGRAENENYFYAHSVRGYSSGSVAMFRLSVQGSVLDAEVALSESGLLYFSDEQVRSLMFEALFQKDPSSSDGLVVYQNRLLRNPVYANLVLQYLKDLVAQYQDPAAMLSFFHVISFLLSLEGYTRALMGRENLPAHVGEVFSTIDSLLRVQYEVVQTWVDRGVEVDIEVAEDAMGALVGWMYETGSGDTLRTRVLEVWHRQFIREIPSSVAHRLSEMVYRHHDRLLEPLMQFDRFDRAYFWAVLDRLFSVDSSQELSPIISLMVSHDWMQIDPKVSFDGLRSLEFRVGGTLLDPSTLGNWLIPYWAQYQLDSLAGADISSEKLAELMVHPAYISIKEASQGTYPDISFFQFINLFGENSKDSLKLEFGDFMEMQFKRYWEAVIAGEPPDKDFFDQLVRDMFQVTGTEMPSGDIPMFHVDLLGVSFTQDGRFPYRFLFGSPLHSEISHRDVNRQFSKRCPKLSGHVQAGEMLASVNCLQGRNTLEEASVWVYHFCFRSRDEVFVGMSGEKCVVFRRSPSTDELGVFDMVEVSAPFLDHFFGPDVDFWRQGNSSKLMGVDRRTGKMVLREKGEHFERFDGEENLVGRLWPPGSEALRQFSVPPFVSQVDQNVIIEESVSDSTVMLRFPSLDMRFRQSGQGFVSLEYPGFVLVQDLSGCPQRIQDLALSHALVLKKGRAFLVIMRPYRLDVSDSLSSRVTCQMDKAFVPGRYVYRFDPLLDELVPNSLESQLYLAYSYVRLGEYTFGYQFLRRSIVNRPFSDIEFKILESLVQGNDYSQDMARLMFFVVGMVGISEGFMGANKESNGQARTRFVDFAGFLNYALWESSLLKLLIDFNAWMGNSKHLNPAELKLLEVIGKHYRSSKTSVFYGASFQYFSPVPEKRPPLSVLSEEAPLDPASDWFDSPFVRETYTVRDPDGRVAALCSEHGQLPRLNRFCDNVRAHSNDVAAGGRFRLKGDFDLSAYCRKLGARSRELAGLESQSRRDIMAAFMASSQPDFQLGIVSEDYPVPTWRDILDLFRDNDLHGFLTFNPTLTPSAARDLMHQIHRYLLQVLERVSVERVLSTAEGMTMPLSDENVQVLGGLLSQNLPVSPEHPRYRHDLVWMTRLGIVFYPDQVAAFDRLAEPGAVSMYRTGMGKTAVLTPAHLDRLVSDGSGELSLYLTPSSLKDQTEQYLRQLGFQTSMIDGKRGFSGLDAVPGLLEVLNYSRSVGSPLVLDAQQILLLVNMFVSMARDPKSVSDTAGKDLVQALELIHSDRTRWVLDEVHRVIGGRPLRFTLGSPRAISEFYVSVASFMMGVLLEDPKIQELVSSHSALSHLEYARFSGVFQLMDSTVYDKSLRPLLVERVIAWVGHSYVKAHLAEFRLMFLDVFEKDAAARLKARFDAFYKVDPEVANLLASGIMLVRMLRVMLGKEAGKSFGPILNSDGSLNMDFQCSHPYGGVKMSPAPSTQYNHPLVALMYSFVYGSVSGLETPQLDALVTGLYQKIQKEKGDFISPTFDMVLGWFGDNVPPVVHQLQHARFLKPSLRASLIEVFSHNFGAMVFHVSGRAKSEIRSYASQIMSDPKILFQNGTIVGYSATLSGENGVLQGPGLDLDLSPESDALLHSFLTRCDVAPVLVDDAAPKRYLDRFVESVVRHGKDALIDVGGWVIMKNIDMVSYLSEKLRPHLSEISFKGIVFVLDKATPSIGSGEKVIMDIGTGRLKRLQGNDPGPGRRLVVYGHQNREGTHIEGVQSPVITVPKRSEENGLDEFTQGIGRFRALISRLKFVAEFMPELAELSCRSDVWVHTSEVSGASDISGADLVMHLAEGDVSSEDFVRNTLSYMDLVPWWRAYQRLLAHSSGKAVMSDKLHQLCIDELVSEMPDEPAKLLGFPYHSTPVDSVRRREIQILARCRAFLLDEDVERLRGLVRGFEARPELHPENWQEPVFVDEFASAEVDVEVKANAQEEAQLNVEQDFNLLEGAVPFVEVEWDLSLLSQGVERLQSVGPKLSSLGDWLGLKEVHPRLFVSENFAKVVDSEGMLSDQLRSKFVYYVLEIGGNFVLVSRQESERLRDVFESGKFRSSGLAFHLHHLLGPKKDFLQSLDESGEYCETPRGAFDSEVLALLELLSGRFGVNSEMLAALRPSFDRDPSGWRDVLNRRFTTLGMKGDMLKLLLNRLFPFS